ncbi:uncharacterized protein [Nicotiana tomentosiformis]|uniref:uncharacterized protein n=1 Tax=Nicotiana tomentosiformis TaxID=4098 RepID=UPI00388C969E
MQGLQTPRVLPAQLVAVAQVQASPIMSEDEQNRLKRFGRLKPPSFSGAESEDAQDFLGRYQRILRTAGILDTSGISFTTFHLMGAAFTWWEIYERGRPAGAMPLLWNEFSVLFLEKFVPLTRMEELRRQFEQLRQEGMSVTQYEMRFSEVAHHTVWLVSTERKRIKRFIDGLNYGLCFIMTRENVSGVMFD